MITTLESRTELDFVLTLRRQWATEVFPSLRREFEALSSTSGPDKQTHLIRGLPSYRLFSWLERGSQKMLWRAVAAAVDAEHPAARVEGTSTVALNPALQLPDWYTQHDFHVQPGGVWSGNRNARIYELGARVVMLGENSSSATSRRTNARMTT